MTANKALIAEFGNEIFALADEHGVEVRFEAAVAGGIPIIKALREGLTANRIEWAAGIINGIGHYWGYRNFEAADASTNISPWGLLIGGEELHNNHHTYPTSAKLSVKPYEFDIGWLYIRVLETLGLAHVKKTPPKLQWGDVQPVANEQTLEIGRAHV